MSFATIQVKNIEDNLYRDTNKFVYDEEKIKSLIESMLQTGFWNNTMVRPFDNLVGGLPATEGLIADAIKVSGGVYDGKVQLSYGHHRLEALRRSGVETVELPIKSIVDEDMLRIMCNENKEGYGAGPLVLMESVSQVKEKLNTHFGQFAPDEHEDYLQDAIKYNADGKDIIMYATPGAWGKMKAAGTVGAEMIAKFLGGSWNTRHVKRAVKAVYGADKGLMSIEEMEQVGSLTLLESLVLNLDFIMVGQGEDKAPEWPMHFKNEIMAHLIKYCIPGKEAKLNKAGVVVLEKKEAEDDPDVVVMIERKLLTASVLDRRRGSMKTNGSRPDKTETAKFDWRSRLFLDATMDVEERILALETVASYIDFEGVEVSDLEELSVKVEEHYRLIKETAKAAEAGGAMAADVQKEISEQAAGTEEGTQVPTENALDTFEFDEEAPVDQNFNKFITLGGKFSDMADGMSEANIDVTPEVLEVAESVLVSAIALLGNERVMGIIKSKKSEAPVVSQASTDGTKVTEGPVDEF